MTKVRNKISKNHYEEILCAGFGGQGIMFMGKLLAQAGLIAGRQVTWMPSYGAEVRGGTAYSMTKISKEEIASPVVTAPDILIVMNGPSFIKYEPRLKEDGILISNKTLIGDLPKKKDKTSINIPMTETRRHTMRQYDRGRGANEKRKDTFYQGYFGRVEVNVEG